MLALLLALTPGWDACEAGLELLCWTALCARSTQPEGSEQAWPRLVQVRGDGQGAPLEHGRQRRGHGRCTCALEHAQASLSWQAHCPHARTSSQPHCWRCPDADPRASLLSLPPPPPKVGNSYEILDALPMNLRGCLMEAARMYLSNSLIEGSCF
jgi:hypothetical protein